MSQSNPRPIPDLINREHEDLALAKRVLIYGKTAAGGFVPLLVDTDGSLGGLDDKYVNVTGDTMTGDLTIQSSDLILTGGGSIDITNGNFKLSTTSSTPFIVEKQDGTDIFVIDTNNNKFGIGTTPLSQAFLTVSKTTTSASETTGMGFNFTTSVSQSNTTGVSASATKNASASISNNQLTGVSFTTSCSGSATGTNSHLLKGGFFQGSLIGFGSDITSSNMQFVYGGDFQATATRLFGGTWSSDFTLVSGRFENPAQAGITGSVIALAGLFEGDTAIFSDKKFYVESSLSGGALTLGDTYHVYDSSNSTWDFFVGGNEIFNMTSAQMEIKKDVIFTGDGTGLPYGSVKISDNTTATTISSSGTYVQVNFDTNGESNNTTPDHTNDHITATKAGRYMIVCSIDAHDMGVNEQYEFAVRINNGATTFDGGLRMHTFATNANQEASITLSGIRDLAANDTIELWVKNNTGTNDVTVNFAELNLVMVGGT